MKLTDFALLFIGIFICAVVVTESYESGLRKVAFTREEYNVVIDRAIDDALENAVNREDYYDRSEIDAQQVIEDMFEELYCVFDIASNDERMSFRAHVPVIAVLEWDGYRLFDYTGENIIAEDKRKYPENAEEFTDEIRNCMEEAINEKVTDEEITLSFAYSEGNDWYQNIDYPSVMTIFYGMPLGNGDRTYNRIFLSGARIDKLKE